MVTIGELMDIFEEKIRTGEISRDDALYIEGLEDADGEESDWYPVQDCRKAYFATVVLDLGR